MADMHETDRPESATTAKPTRSRPDAATIALVVIATILTISALRLMSSVLVPLAVAVILTLIVAPLRDWVARHTGRQWAGITAAMATMVMALLLFMAGAWIAARQVAQQTPQLQAALGNLLGATVSEGEPRPVTEARDVLGSLGEQMFRSVGEIAARIAQTSLSVAGALVIIFFMILLMLAESRDWRAKIRTISPHRVDGDLVKSTEVISVKLQRYLLIRVVLGLATAALYCGWLWLFGVDLILVWAMISFLLNFIPTLGSIIAGVMLVLYTLVTKDLGTAAAVAAGILVIEQIMGNYVDPKLAGRSISLSPLVVLVALLFWGWVWGIAGALLAVPMTTVMVVIGAHVPATRPFALLLTDRTSMAGLDDATTNP